MNSFAHIQGITCEPAEIIEETNQLEPYILVVDDGALLIVDSQIIGPVETQDLVLSLILCSISATSVVLPTCIHFLSSLFSMAKAAARCQSFCYQNYNLINIL